MIKGVLGPSTGLIVIGGVEMAFASTRDVGTRGRYLSDPAGRAEREADHVGRRFSGTTSLTNPVLGQLGPERRASRSSHPRTDGSGSHLVATDRSLFESSFGFDFGHVRIHSDAAADSAARSIGARAFTSGSDIYFRSGEYSPSTGGGRQLLAHELTHVVQRGQGGRPNGADTMAVSEAPDADIQRQFVGAPKKTVDVYAVSLPGSARSPDPDINRANAVWSQCQVAVNLSGGQSWQTNALDAEAPAGVLNEYADPAAPTAEEPAESSLISAGRCRNTRLLRPEHVGRLARGGLPAVGPTPDLPAALVISDSAASDTLAHELGHILLNEAGHHADPDNLMASGTIRNVGVDKLDAAQCGKI